MTERLPAWLSMNPDRLGFSVIEERAAIVRRMFKDADRASGSTP
ncbi:hypothetical protein [Mesorhizobium muleiense]|uniref:Uncharacterized protein n=1 Tax=Mesorhizobium muleiense TaxID=1004279 RepID=A0A1G9AC38_9HYPH|nr:hypothetical protein [Mesorhizobium muleiense]SDK24384.1 hypothetical protein SAMN05428953_11322 [Mesorhizobium muleiense]